MSRAQAVVDHLVERRLVEAAAERFDRDGYRGASIRQIASDAGCSAACFYEHFRSKQAILREIVDSTYAGAVAEMEAAVTLAGDDLAGRLDAAVWAQCDFHMRRCRSWRVAQREMGHLDAVDRERLMAKRLRLAQILFEIISEGVTTGAFEVSQPETTSWALSSMCGSIGSWYDPGGHAVPRQVAESYCELAARMAGVAATDAPGARRLAAVPARLSA